jgi:hypothetical protein
MVQFCRKGREMSCIGLISFSTSVHRQQRDEIEAQGKLVEKEKSL